MAGSEKKMFIAEPCEDMSNPSDFIQDKIQAMDAEIEKAKRIMLQLEKEENPMNQKNYYIIKAKLADWIEKRDFLVQLLIKQVERRSL